MARGSVLVIDDDNLMRDYVRESLERAGFAVDAVSGGKTGLELLGEKPFDLVVTDLKMTPIDGLEVVRQARELHPKIALIVMTAYGTIDTAVEAMKAGAEDYILKPFPPDAIEMAVERAVERTRLAEENSYLREADRARYDFDGFVGDSAAMEALYAQVKKIAPTRSTVFVRGESGTGKELVARALHRLSDRCDKPFIKVNCAALSAGLLESELFGHEKGSFTGAHERKIGRFELADGGTLLLDEISEIPIELQSKLLRALQEREIDRVGGATPIQVDTRIVATSNRDLEQSVKRGDFREDLYFRLNVIPLQLPPLRERTEDIPPLVRHFVARFGKENGRPGIRVTEACMRKLQVQDWPGNVRELQNAVERAVVLSASDELDAADFNLGSTVATPGREPDLRAGMTVADMERALIFKTLEACGDNRTHAAELLGISVRTLRNKLNEYRQTQ